MSEKIPFTEYRERSKHLLTSHQLADFRRCPLIYQQKKIGVIQDVDTAAFQIGRAFHSLVLEPDMFSQEYQVGGPVNPKTGKEFGADTNKFRDAQAETEKEIIRLNDFSLIEKMKNSIMNHAVASVIMNDGVAEMTFTNKILNVDCQSRPDWITNDNIVELKTCEKLEFFEADSHRYSYINQLAFYQSVTELNFPCLIVVVEKSEPYRCGVWRVADESLLQAREQNIAAIKFLSDCEDSGCWPTGYEDERILV